MSPDPNLFQLRAAGPGDKAVSLMELAYRRAGIRRGGRIIAFVTSWAVAQGALGHELGQGEGVTAAVEEFRAYWNEKERTVWRDLELFRLAFPGEETPARLIALADEARADQKSAAAGVAGLRVAAG